MHRSIKVTLLVAAAIAFATTIWLAAMDRTASMAIAATMALGLVVAAHIELLKSIRFGVLQAELRNVAAEMETLKRTNLVFARAIALLIARAGRLGSEDSHYFQSIASISKHLQGIGASDEEIESAISSFYETKGWDHVIRATGHQIPKGLTPEQQQEWKALREAVSKRDVTPGELESAFSRWRVLSDEAREMIEDYRYFRENRELRRPKEWNEFRAVDWKLEAIE